LSQSELSRRRLVQGVAVGGLSLPLLAACGSGGGSTTAPTTQDPSTPSGSNGGKSTKSAAPAATSLVATADVPMGGGVILASHNVVVTQPSKGSFEGFSATCTHQGCTLATVADGTINCGCHGSQFSIKDGSNVTGPSGSPAGSVAPLPRVSVKAQGTDIVEA
jgi:nitrite reductase/ring-hydroxylating ferredoxin subunit